MNIQMWVKLAWEVSIAIVGLAVGMTSLLSPMALFLLPAMIQIIALVRTMFIERRKKSGNDTQVLHTLDEEEDDPISVSAHVNQSNNKVRTSFAVQLCALCMFIVACCVFMLNGPEPLCSGTITPLAAMGMMPLMVGIASRCKK